MGTLRVTTDELLATANGWHGLSADLLTAAPSELGLSCQASATAVNAVHGGTAAASAAFAARTQITAVKTAVAAIAYASTETTSAQMFSALTESL